MDNCLKPFITYDWTEKGSETLGNSCWLDSLFVALFHNNTESIKKFKNDLQPKIYNNENENKIQLEQYNNEIIKLIKEQYNIINEPRETPEITNTNIIRCRTIRHILETHRQLSKNYNYNSFLGMNSVFELLMYLKNYVLDTNSFNKIYIKELLSFDEMFIDDSKDIQIINMQYQIPHFSIIQPHIKENLNNYYLNSIIVHNGIHYMCYYKCNNSWYFYDDMGMKISPDNRDKNTRTIFIGDLKDVIKHHIKKITAVDHTGHLEIMLLYLKNNSPEEQLFFEHNAARKQIEEEQKRERAWEQERERVRQQNLLDEKLAQKIRQQDIEQLQQQKELREQQVQRETDEILKEIEREKQERARLLEEQNKQYIRILLEKEQKEQQEQIKQDAEFAKSLAYKKYGGDYTYKYLKYKHKYLKYKQNLNI
jgi:hypothetical protein